MMRMIDMQIAVRKDNETYLLDTDKILYIDNYHDTDLSGAFAGFLTLPAFVWGLFFMVITSLPVIYYSFSRRKA